MRSCGTSMLVTAGLIVAVGCVTGKRSEDKTGLDRLNGETYISEPSAALMAGPVIPIYLGNQKARVTKVSGGVWRGEGLNRSAVGQAVVQIRKEGNVLAEVTSEPNGDFKMFPTLPNGGYTLHVESGGQTAELGFFVKGYEVKNLNITVGK